LDAPEWHRGWILFVDPNGNREHEIDEEIVQVRPPARGRIAITSSPFRKRLFFQPNGMSLGSNATITLCSDEARATPRAVILANTGRSRVSHTQSDGSGLDCG
jgi:type IV fimbrial biogenesis protein FimT